MPLLSSIPFSATNTLLLIYMAVAAAGAGDDGDGHEKGNSFNYLIVRPENGGIEDLLSFLVLPNDAKSIVSSSLDFGDHRWVILVSILVRKVLALVSKPMEYIGYFLDFFLNLLSLNGGNLISLLFNFLNGKVVIPRRGSQTFVSSVCHLDPRIDLYKNELTFLQGIERPAAGTDDINGDPCRWCTSGLEVERLMDLSIMSAKLAYENANVVRNVVTLHWKMHFVDFYDCWNDYQKERSTQVFVLTDKPEDANLILISFRGTEPYDADDWSTDVDYSWYEIPNVGKVHMGFLEALGLGSRTDTSSFANHLKSTQQGPDDNMRAYFGLRSKVKILLNEHKNAKLIVTGHSLGAALAILFVTLLVVHEEMELMERLLGVYTFGQPRIGDMQVASYMERHLLHPVPRYFRFVYCNDIVPRLPYDDKTFLYKHFGICLYYNSMYIQQQVEEEPNRNYFGALYVIPDHMNAVWELIRGLVGEYVYGAEYNEGWLAVMLRIVGLALPGVSAHSPINYVNSVRLGKTNKH